MTRSNWCGTPCISHWRGLIWCKTPCICKDERRVLFYTGFPNKHGSSVTNSISSLLWISIVCYVIFVMSARVYFMKTRYVTINVSDRGTVKTDKFTLYCFYTVILFILRSTVYSYYNVTLYSQNINKQIVNIADKILTDYSFLCRYNYT